MSIIKNITEKLGLPFKAKQKDYFRPTKSHHLKPGEIEFVRVAGRIVRATSSKGVVIVPPEISKNKVFFLDSRDTHFLLIGVVSTRGQESTVKAFNLRQGTYELLQVVSSLIN